METSRSGFLPVPPDMGKITLPANAICSDFLAPGSSEAKWIRQWLSLIVISAFLIACTLAPQKSERSAKDASQETAKDLSGDSLVEAQRAELDKPGPNAIARGSLSGVNKKKVSEVDEDHEVASFEIDLANFKDRLVTLSSAEVIDLMGRPEFERSEPPARIWQYRSPACVIDLFLYDEGGELAVEYVDLRTRGPRSDGVSDRDCFVSSIQ